MVNRELDRIATLARAFQTAGKQLYLVGGCVRDKLLGRPTADFDLATDAVPEEIKRLAATCRPDSIYAIGEKFGTIGLIFDTMNVEITTYRAEWYAADSRKPQVRFGASLEGDLARRDFTINAMAQHPITGNLVDPFRGVDDLRDRVIRAVGKADERFVEDPLRLLRAIRFAAELAFEVEPTTMRAIVDSHARLRTVSAERIRDELNRVMLSSRPAWGIRLLANAGLLALTIPELIALRGIGEGDRRHKDLFEHTLAVVDRTPPQLGLRWAALLHDIGKPATRSVENGVVHFYDHDLVGADLARKALQRLRFDSRYTARMVKLVRLHMRANLYDSSWSDSALRRFIRESGGELDELIALSRADVTSRRPEKVASVASRVDELAQRCRALVEKEQVEKLKSPLDGNELMEIFQRPPGPWIKPVKDFLLSQVLDGVLVAGDRAAAREMAVRFVQERGL